jgi:hypothetical protein
MENMFFVETQGGPFIVGSRCFLEKWKGTAGKGLKNVRRRDRPDLLPEHISDFAHTDYGYVFFVGYDELCIIDTDCSSAVLISSEATAATVYQIDKGHFIIARTFAPSPYDKECIAGALHGRREQSLVGGIELSKSVLIFDSAWAYNEAKDISELQIQRGYYDIFLGEFHSEDLEIHLDIFSFEIQGIFET